MDTPAMDSQQLTPKLSSAKECGVALSSGKLSSPSEDTMDMNGCRRSDRMLTYLSPVRDVSRRISWSHIKPTAHAPYNHRASTSLNSPQLICRVHGFMRLSPNPYAPIRAQFY
ncbi:hypothetical protein TNCV_4013701 [Trichonephila clavipes]|nr:hypothetical protein TNCV_4013701 [Trichonephila clavipes]